jgi:hypothetical protein
MRLLGIFRMVVNDEALRDQLLIPWCPVFHVNHFVYLDGSHMVVSYCLN